VPLIFQRELVLKSWAKAQPYVFAIGVGGISLFMMGAGTLGVPRRDWDISGADALISFDYPATAYLMMGLNGMAAVLAAVGGLMYIVVVVGSILFGERTPEKAPEPAAAPEPSVVSHYGSAGTLKLPGTAVLVSVFFTAFVLYYFVNWKFLSEVWPLR
jgi:cytochrome c oxidase subunit 1